MLCTPEHVKQCVELGVDFIVLGGNPESGTSIHDIVACTKWVKELYGDKLFVFAGKWEDGVGEKVLGDPLAQYDAKEVIRELIDAGADPDTVRLIALKMKETGADVHAIGDGGFSGCTSPENIQQLSISIKGKPYTYFRMASWNK